MRWKSVWLTHTKKKRNSTETNVAVDWMNFWLIRHRDSVSICSWSAKKLQNWFAYVQGRIWSFHFSLSSMWRRDQKSIAPFPIKMKSSPDPTRYPFFFFPAVFEIRLILLYFETRSCPDTTCLDVTRALRQCVSPFTKSFSADRVRLRGFCLVGTHDRTWRHWNYATVDCRCQMRSDTRGVLLPSRCDSTSRYREVVLVFAKQKIRANERSCRCRADCLHRFRLH